jgi:hypothetical protein
MAGGPVGGMQCRLNPPTVLVITLPPQKEQIIEIAGKKTSTTDVPIKIMSQYPPIVQGLWCGQYKEVEYNLPPLPEEKRIIPPAKEPEKEGA